jgi:hypothetical protein
LRVPLLDDGMTHHVQVTLGALTVPGVAKGGEVRQSAGLP